MPAASSREENGPPHNNPTTTSSFDPHTLQRKNTYPSQRNRDLKSPATNKSTLPNIETKSKASQHNPNFMPTMLTTSMMHESKNNGLGPKNTLSNRSHYSSVQFNQLSQNRVNREVASPVLKKNLGNSHFSSLGLSKSMDLLLIGNDQQSRSQSRKANIH